MALATLAISLYHLSQSVVGSLLRAKLGCQCCFKGVVNLPPPLKKQQLGVVFGTQQSADLN